MGRKLLAILSFIALFSGVFTLVLDQTPAQADHQQVMIDDGGGSSGNEVEGPREYGTCGYFLGMRSWDCEVPKVESESDLKFAIPQIALNVAEDLSILVAYLIIGYVIYAGYLYMFSGGDPNKAATGKKALVHAFTGLAIAMSANLIMNTIRITLLGSGGRFINCENQVCVDPSDLVIRVINWFIGVAGVVSVVFLIYGGVLHITSSGDPTKAKKARDVMKYSLIGLAIVALVTTITALISNAIRTANDTSYINQLLISKEVHEKNS